MITEVTPLHASATNSDSPPGRTRTLPSRAIETPRAWRIRTEASETKNWSRTMKGAIQLVGTGTMKSRKPSGKPRRRSQAGPRA